MQHNLQVLYEKNDEFKVYEMGGSCSTHEESCFDGKARRQETTRKS
jgi:hypothetical protein